MCCEDHEEGELPPLLVQMLAEYEELHTGVRFDWGREFREEGDLLPGEARQFWDYGRFAETSRVMATAATLEVAGRPAGWDDALWELTASDPPLGLAVVELTVGEPVVRCRRQLAIEESGESIGALVRNSTPSSVRIDVNGAAVEVGADRALLAFVELDADHPDLVLQLDGATYVHPVLTPCGSAVLRLTSSSPCRWSVTDDRGGGWFPAGSLRKWDAHGRPFFHGRELSVRVPAAGITARAWRGTEYRGVGQELTLAAGTETTVALEPELLYDAAARGWYGGDLHVHLNYTGDFVAHPSQAAAMQEGEGLHLMNLVAGNLFTTRVYDREALETFAGEDLTWSDEHHVARWGMEYRNDMLGHFHALGPSAPPIRYQSGHTRSANPDDWPPNAVACQELRDLGATVGYTHPVLAPMPEGRPDNVFAMPRTAEAREAVADAALGLVDSIDLGGGGSFDGACALYYRLLSCGLRLAATAGTDVFLSFAHFGRMSNPPGWARAYADLGATPLSVPAWQDAVRAGRTFVTNGPWLELAVDGHGPGELVDVPAGRSLSVHASCRGQGVERLAVMGPDGPVGEIAVVGEDGTLDLELDVREPTWLAAVARGPSHPDVLGPDVYAHSTPVYLSVDGRAISRPADAAWCLDWIDRLESIARDHGHFSSADQLDELVGVLDQARAYYREIVDG